jgi:hypothetical protein
MLATAWRASYLLFPVDVATRCLHPWLGRRAWTLPPSAEGEKFA